MLNKIKTRIELFKVLFLFFWYKYNIMYVSILCQGGKNMGINNKNTKRRNQNHRSKHTNISNSRDMEKNTKNRNTGRQNKW